MTGGVVEDYCGCCGRAIIDTVVVRVWCDDCSKPGHLGLAGPPWERTYQAVTGEPCPFKGICPTCGKPIIDFDKTSDVPTCNPVTSPECWLSEALE